MNNQKIVYSITRTFEAYNSYSEKRKYDKVVKCLKMFYNEGIKDKNAACELRDKTLEECVYNSRSRYSGSLNSFLSLFSGASVHIENFYNYCNSTKKLKNLFNLKNI